MKRFLLVCGASLTLVGLSQAKDLNSIGVAVGTAGNPYFVRLAKGIEVQAKKINPRATVTMVGCDYDINKQSTQIDNFIAAGVDLILANAVDEQAIEPAFARARKAGITVLSVDSAGKGADATIMTNNVQAGENACRYIVEKLKGKGNVVIANGPPVSGVFDRVNGCKAELAKGSGIKILSENQNAKATREGGLEVMIGLLTAFDKIDAVFAINDPSAIGADLAAKQMGRKGIVITSVDGSPDMEDSLKDPNSLLEATSSQDPYAEGQMAVRIGYDLMQGKKPEKAVTLMPSVLVTRTNVKAYKGWKSE